MGITMNVRLDLNLRCWARQRGEITAIGTWVTINGRAKPCMVLVRTGDKPADMRPFVITGDRAWIWSEDIGDPIQSAHQCFRIAECLNLDPEPSTIIKIVSFVHDHLGDLLTIPPFPPAAAPANIIAELVITERATGKTHEVALSDV